MKRANLDEDACGEEAAQHLAGDVGEAQQVDVEQRQVLIASHQGIEIIHHLLLRTRQDPHPHLHIQEIHTQSGVYSYTSTQFSAGYHVKHISVEWRTGLALSFLSMYIMDPLVAVHMFESLQSCNTNAMLE